MAAHCRECWAPLGADGVCVQPGCGAMEAQAVTVPPAPRVTVPKAAPGPRLPATPTLPELPELRRLSGVARRLEDVFETIRRNHRELPHFVVVVATGAEGKRGVTHWGHFAPRRWIRRTAEQHGDVTVPAMAEIKISAEGLHRPPVDVLETMLHECAHALAEVRGIKDTSDGGRWHNAKFAALAREVGLTPPGTPAPRVGYSYTTPSPELATRYGSALRELEEALTLYRTEPARAERSETRKGGKRVSPECECGRRIQVVPSVLEQGPIVCGVCRKPFAVEAGEDPRDTCDVCAELGDDCPDHGRGGETDV